MSVIVYCIDYACFHKQLCDNADDVMKVGWAKVTKGYSCLNHSWESKDEDDTARG